MLNKYDKRNKEYRRLLEELHEVQHEIREQPYKQCKPFQRGWKIYVSFRDDIMKRDDIYFLHSLLAIGQEKHLYTNNIKDIKSIRKGIYYIYYQNYCRSLFPKRKHISEKQYNSLNERQKKYFFKSEKYGRIYYKLSFPLYWLKLKVKPNIITQLQDINPELESKEAKIKNKLWKNYWWRYDTYPKGLKHVEHKTRHYIKRETQKLIKEYDEVFCQEYFWNEDLQCYSDIEYKRKYNKDKVKYEQIPEGFKRKYTKKFSLEEIEEGCKDIFKDADIL